MNKHFNFGVNDFDIIVGIPSYKEEETISFVTKQCALGLKKYFPEYSALIVNVDNNSPDKTKENFLNTDTLGIKKLYISTPPGIKGKGNNFYNLFKLVSKLKPLAVIVVDADLKSITPEWIKKLAEPIINGYDFVTPLYARHKYDGTITNHIVFPFVYSLFGKKVRQPIGGDFAFSSRLAEYWLNKEWTETTRQYGIDIFMTLHALTGNFKVCAVDLGTKIHKPKDPASSLGPMFKQVIGTLFNVILENKNLLFNKRIESIDIFGDGKIVEPPHINVNKNALIISFREGFREWEDVLEKILNKENFNELKLMVSGQDINIDANLWAKILYDALVSYSYTNDKELVLEALQPLYFGRVYTYVKETEKHNTVEAEKYVYYQADVFLRTKEYLIKRFEDNTIKTFLVSSKIR